MCAVNPSITCATASEDFYRMAADFSLRSRELGAGDLSRYYWYHTINLGQGLVTPGLYDYRDTLDSFQLPGDMRGMNVLDVGSATGFFAFEFERRGAQVVSVELPSLNEIDRFPGQTTEQVVDKIRQMLPPMSPNGQPGTYTTEELYFYLLEGAFSFCQKRLDSNVKRHYSTVYNLSATSLEKSVGVSAFDLIFLGDILVHTLNPLMALAAVAPLCKGTLILSQVMMPEKPTDQPAMIYMGGEDPAQDDVFWWSPNRLCFIQMLKKLGFRKVAEAGCNQGVLRPSGFPFQRTVLHASR
ncbi:MAG: hypothetical protein A3F68_10115 [Acidobacteria bacterium RIFCSPLOWO2_12_FULL_54_10]|nr:MAG: hypothetical protein A3F68_10115 [Acidobacteria bacterium RIFCSPLOWO2_12_FULL_54_10]